MPAPRKPTEVLSLTGAFRKNPQRARPVGPKSSRPLGDPPAYMAEDEAACWAEFVANGPAGVLTSGDREVVELIARLMAKFRRDWLNGAELATLKTSLGELGRTPASRSKVSAPENDKPAGAFDAFLQ